MRRALGNEMAQRIGPIWGEDKDAELANMFKRTPQQGVWFIAGSLTQARIYSKYMALQIKAIEEGLVDTNPFARATSHEPAINAVTSEVGSCSSDAV